MRVNFSDFSVDVEGHLTETEPKIYDAVHLNYSIKVNKEDEEKVLKAVKLSKEKYCGVSKMFESFAKVSFEINYL
jgi:putative redox protein